MIAALLALATAVAFQDSTRLTLGDVVNRAIASHPSVAIARAQRDRAGTDLRDARAAYAPKLGVDANITRYQLPWVVAPLHGFDLSHPPIFDRTLVQSGLSVTWTAYNFGTRRARITGQSALGSAAEENISAAETQLVARVATSYLRLFTARGLLAVQDQRIVALTADLDQVRQLVTEGKAARVEQLRVDAELARARADRITSATQIEMAEHDLAQLANLSYAAVHASALPSVRLTATGALSDTSEASRMAMLARARDASPDMRASADRIEAAHAAVQYAHAATLPDVTLSGAYIDRGRLAADFEGEWQAGLMLSYPIYSGGTGANALDRAAADERIAVEQRRLSELTIETGVDQALASLRDANARVTALESAVTQSTEVVRVEQLSLDVGSSVQSDFLDAQAALLQASAALIEARYDAITARVDLARLVGELSPEWLSRAVESAP